MQSSLVGRVALGIAVVAAAVVLLLVLKDDESGEDHLSAGAPTRAESNGTGSGGKEAKPAEPSIPAIVVKNGKPVGGVTRLSFDAGDRIRFVVRANTDDEVHVHGYDVEKEVGPGRVAKFDFPATIEGVFEAELHGSGEEVAELQIEP